MGTQLEPAPSSPRSRFSRFAGATSGDLTPLQRILIYLWFALLASALVVISSHRGGRVSINDETTHADYAYQIAHGHIPAKGSVIAPEILKEWSCRGSWNLAPLPPCKAASYPPAKYPANGYNYNFGHPPLYYAITGVLARAAGIVVGPGHFMALARISGAAWLIAAMMVLFSAIRRFGVGWRYALAGTTLLPLCPGVLQATSMITNDAPAVLCGAIAIYLIAGALRTGRTGIVAPLVLTFCVTATKVLNATPMLILACVLLYLGIAAWRTDRPAARRFIGVAVGIVVVMLLVFKGWELFQAHRGVAGWVNPIQGVSGRAISGSSVDELLSTTFNGFQLVTGYWVQPQLDGETVSLWARLLGVLFAAAPFVVLGQFRRRTPEMVLALATIGGLLGYPLIVELQVYLESGQYFPVVPSRYGITLVPFAIACLMIAVSKRKLIRTSFVLSAVGLAVTVLAVTGLYALGPPVS